MYALYQVSVRQATISLSLLLACTSRYKPWELLWSSSATTPLVDFHHRLAACPSYKEMAQLIFLSGASFCRLFKRVMGKTFSEYINALRIREAKRLLLVTNEKIINISTTVGYDNVTYFNKVFLRECGLSPGSYRKNAFSALS